MTYLLKTPREGGDYVARCVPDADRPVPYIRGCYPSQGDVRIAWHNIWTVLSGGLWFTVDELLSFEPPIIGGMTAESVARLLRQAREAGWLSSRPRVMFGHSYAEYSRNYTAQQFEFMSCTT